MLNLAVQGVKFRGDDAALAQVGWVGQGGEVYPLDGQPAQHEPGGYRPLYIQVGHYVPNERGDGYRLED